MLSAFNENKEVIIASKDLSKDEKYFCRFCGGELILKRGTIKVPHFAHKVNSDCKMEELITKGKCAKGESEFHRECKMFIKEQMERLSYVDHVDLEVPIGNRIADIVIYFNDRVNEEFREKNSKLIVEIQLSKISQKELSLRSEDYIKEGFKPNEIVWIVGNKNRGLYEKHQIIKIDKSNNMFSFSEYIPPSTEYVSDRTYDLCGEHDIFEKCTKYSELSKQFKICIIEEKKKLCKKFLKDENIEIINLLNIIIEGRIIRYRLKKALGVEENKIKIELENQRNKYIYYKDLYIKKYNIKEKDFDRIINGIADIQNRFHFDKELCNSQAEELFELMKEVFTIEDIKFEEDKCKYSK